jgi:Zn-dependent metalloprotease
MFVKPTTMYPIGEAKAPTEVKGVPVSGRSWKLECKRKSSMAVAGKLIRKSWDDKMAAKAVHQAIKSKEKSLIDARIEERKRKKQEREDRKKRKEQNQLKSAVFQVHLMILITLSLSWTAETIRNPPLRSSLHIAHM